LDNIKIDLIMNTIGVVLVEGTCKHHKKKGIHEKLKKDKPLKSKYAAFTQH